MENLINNKNPLDRDFYKNLLLIATPIALAQLLSSLLAVVDGFMVSSLGDIPVAAVGIGANFAFFMTMILFGFFSGMGIFVAQYWGSKEITNVQKVFLMSLIIGIAVGFLFFIFAFFFTDILIGLYNNGANLAERAELHSYAYKYIRIASWSYLLMAINFAINMVMRSIEKVWYPQFVLGGIVLVNTFLNYGLINGNMGFANLGVEGAAIATLISNIIGTIFLLGYVIISNHEVFAFKLNILKDITFAFILKIFKRAFPVALNESFWGLGMSMYLIAFGFISTDAITSMHLSNLIMGLFWVINAGIGSASAIMIGKKLGENKLDVARHWGNKITKIVFFIGVVLGVTLFFGSELIANMFKEVSDPVHDNIILILRVFSIYLPFKFTNAQQITGTLRSGGDTLYTLFSEVLPLWLIGVPLAFILSIYSSLPIYLIVAIINIEELVKLTLLLGRFFTYKWVKNLTT